VNPISKSKTTLCSFPAIARLQRIEAQQPQPGFGARPVRGAGQEVQPAAGAEYPVALDHLAFEHVHVLARGMLVDVRPLAARRHLDDPRAHAARGRQVAAEAARPDLDPRNIVDGHRQHPAGHRGHRACPGGSQAAARRAGLRSHVGKA
jgi:hypothetical protein